MLKHSVLDCSQLVDQVNSLGYRLSLEGSSLEVGLYGPVLHLPGEELKSLLLEPTSHQITHWSWLGGRVCRIVLPVIKGPVV